MSYIGSLKTEIKVGKSLLFHHEFKKGAQERGRFCSLKHLGTTATPTGLIPAAQCLATQSANPSTTPDVPSTTYYNTVP